MASFKSTPTMVLFIYLFIYLSLSLVGVFTFVLSLCIASLYHFSAVFGYVMERGWWSWDDISFPTTVTKYKKRFERFMTINNRYNVHN